MPNYAARLANAQKTRKSWEVRKNFVNFPVVLKVVTHNELTLPCYFTSLDKLANILNATSISGKDRPNHWHWGSVWTIAALQLQAWLNRPLKLCEDKPRQYWCYHSNIYYWIGTPWHLRDAISYETTWYLGASNEARHNIVKVRWFFFRYYDIPMEGSYKMPPNRLILSAASLRYSNSFPLSGQS